MVSLNLPGDGLVDDLLVGSTNSMSVLAMMPLVLVRQRRSDILDDGVHAPASSPPDLLTAEVTEPVYPGSRGRIDHLRGLAVLVKDQDACFLRSREQALYDGEYHAHHEVAQKPVLA